MNTKKAVIIVAGGSGSRMGTDVPKQFLPFANNTVLMHTISRFYDFDRDIFICIVLPENQFFLWQNLCEKYQFGLPHVIVAGGNTRFQSVKNGLDAIPFIDGFVAVHDGVRPLVSPKLIQDCFEFAKQHGNAIAAVKPKDSIRRLISNNVGLNTISVHRNDYFLVQTPQIFSIQDIKLAYQTQELPTFTDDASVMEAKGHSIFLVDGEYKNIKITTPDDLVLANALLNF